MAKPLTEEPPSSSVANALIESASRATAPAGQAAPRPRLARQDEPKVIPLSVPVGDVEAANITREFVLTQTADDTSADLTALLRKATRTRLNNSTVMRCLLKTVRHAWPELEHEAQRIGPLRLPAKGNDTEREAFEQRITASIVAGLRAARAYHPNEPSTSDEATQK